MGEVTKYGPPCDQCGQPEGDHRVFAMDHGFRRKESLVEQAKTALMECRYPRSGHRLDRVERLVTAARSEGARQEQERIRGRALTDELGRKVGRVHAFIIANAITPSTALPAEPAWRALLAAITQVSEANTHDGTAVTEGE